MIEKPESGLKPWEVDEIFHEFASGAPCSVVAKRRGMDFETAKAAVTQYWWTDWQRKNKRRRKHG